MNKSRPIIIEYAATIILVALIIITGMMIYGRFMQDLCMKIISVL